MSADPTAEAIARFHRENAAAWREELEIRLLWPELAGGSLNNERWTPFDAEKAMRAGAAFGLVGGELCGCHVQGCELCLSNGGCGQEDCGPCENSLRAYKDVVTRYRMGQGLGQGEVVGSGASPGVEVPEHEFGVVEPPPSYVDAHLHLRGPTQADWDAGVVPALDATIDTIAGELVGQGVTQAVLSVQTAVEEDPAHVNGHQLDDVCLYAQAKYPSLFVPLARGFRPGHPRSLVYVKAALESGAFEGIGELLVHDASGATTQSYEVTSVHALIQLFRVVANHQKVVQVHWNIASMDPNYTTVSPTQSFSQLREVLDAFPNIHPRLLPQRVDPMPLKIILAHCGAGPDANLLSPANRFYDFSNFLATYERWLDEALEAYPNLYFDLAGMQIDKEVECLYDSITNTKTRLGELLIRKINDWPDRFLVGTDTIGNTPGDVSTYAQSYRSYIYFLETYTSYAGAPVAEPDKVLSTNWTAILADVF